MAAPDFEVWWKEPKAWLVYPQAQKQASKAAWDALEAHYASANKAIAPCKLCHQSDKMERSYFLYCNRCAMPQ